jgi:hypothetical protein
MNIPNGMDSVNGAEIAHGLLIALLKEHHNGTVELPIASLENHMGDPDGRMLAFTIEPSETPGMVRLVTVDIANPDRPETASASLSEAPMTPAMVTRALVDLLHRSGYLRLEAYRPGPGSRQINGWCLTSEKEGFLLRDHLT